MVDDRRDGGGGGGRTIGERARALVLRRDETSEGVVGRDEDDYFALIGDAEGLGRGRSRQLRS